MDVVARVVDQRRGHRQEDAGGDGRGASQLPAQEPRQSGHDRAQQGRCQAQGDRRRPAQEQRHDAQNVEQRAVVVGRVVLVDTLPQQTEQEDDVRPLVVVQRTEVQARQAQARRKHEQKQGNRPLDRARSGRPAVRPLTVHRIAPAHRSSTE